jgi:hypothetical protein
MCRLGTRQASQILPVLSPEDGESAFRRHEPAKAAPPVDDGHASAATAYQLRGGEFLVGLGPDRGDRLDELRKPDIGAGGEQPLDRDETKQALALADRYVNGALVGTAGKPVANVARTARRVGTRDRSEGIDRRHRLRRRRRVFASSSLSRATSPGTSA